MGGEESVLIAEAFHIVCTFRKEDLMMIDAKVIGGEKQLALKQNNVQVRGFTPIGRLELFPHSMWLLNVDIRKKCYISKYYRISETFNYVAMIKNWSD